MNVLSIFRQSLYYFKMNAERRLAQDAELMGVNLDDSDNFDKENVYLPVNFTGSVLWASDNVFYCAFFIGVWVDFISGV